MKTILVIAIVAAVGCKGKTGEKAPAPDPAAQPSEDTPAEPTTAAKPTAAAPAAADAPATAAAAAIVCANGAKPTPIAADGWSANSDEGALDGCFLWPAAGGVAIELTTVGDSELLITANGKKLGDYAINLARGSSATLRVIDGKLAVVVTSGSGSQDEGDASAALFAWDAAGGAATREKNWSGSDLDDIPAFAGGEPASD